MLWRSIRDFPAYEISDTGLVHNIHTGEYLKPQLHTGKYTTYLRVQLCNKAGRKNKRIHRLVAEAFISNPLQKEHVNHRDANTFNNLYSNLEWMTHKENMRHRDDPKTHIN